MNVATAASWPANLPDDALDRDRMGEIASLESFRPGLVARLIGLFRDAVGQHLPVCADLECLDDKAVKSSAHALKGAAASVGAERLARTAAACESRPDDVSPGSARAAVSAEAQRALEQLDQWSADLT